MLDYRRMDYIFLSSIGYNINIEDYHTHLLNDNC